MGAAFSCAPAQEQRSGLCRAFSVGTHCRPFSDLVAYDREIAFTRLQVRFPRSLERVGRDLAKCNVRYYDCRECRCPRAFRGTIILKTILYVDDDPDLRDVIATILAEGGYSVITASDGYEAVRLLADQSVDLLITDVRMPGISGFDLARQAKLMRPNLHVIYISGYNADVARGAGPIYGVVLQKPIRTSDLIQEVGQQLSSAPPDTG